MIWLIETKRFDSKIQEDILNKDFIFIQDSASAFSHRVKTVQSCLKEKFIKWIVKNLEWPLSSDCNPLDYSFWN